MKLLYAIQGTGNGHLSRARKIVPILKEKFDLDILVSGDQAQVETNFEVNYRYNGLSFRTSKKGKVSVIKSLTNAHPIDLLRDIRKFPAKKYDLIISDFEPISAWSALLNNVPCVQLSHNIAIKSKLAPKPDFKDAKAQLVLDFYCPAKLNFGFHFEQYDENTFLPVIRDEIRNLPTSNMENYLVYLPAYHDDKIFAVLSNFDVKWIVFSKFSNKKYTKKNVTFCPIENDLFLEKLADSQGVLCGAGFELPAEIIHLGKKLMVIPMAGQYEQWCNAEALKRMGVMTLPSLDLSFFRNINYWINFSKPIQISFPDSISSDLNLVIEKSMNHFYGDSHVKYMDKSRPIYNLWNHKFRTQSL